MNGSHAPKDAPALQRLTEKANEICCEHIKKYGFGPGLHDFEEAFAPILKDVLLNERLQEQIAFGEGDTRRNRIFELLMELR